MAARKIPAFLSKKFNSLPKKGKDELLFKLDAWKESELTRELLSYINDMLIIDEETEDKTPFESEFKTIQEYAWHKGRRNTLRTLSKQLERDE